MNEGTRTRQRTEVAPAALVGPAWSRARFWVALALAVVVIAVAIGTLGESPGQVLDPASTQPTGGKALAQLLRGYGTTVTSTTDLQLSGTVLVTQPDDYSDAQLRRLTRDADRLVLVRPGTRAAHAVSSALEPRSDRTGSSAPHCSDEGARAAGDANLPDDTVEYGGRGTSCYGGAVIVSAHLVVIGSAMALENGSLADRGLAALDVNAITANRTVPVVQWLQPGASAAGSGPASVWDVFPPGAHRAFLWLILVGVIVVLWRARRLGAVVTEPLPVIVRSAEVVEGHGRLYERAGARDRAARALRTATTARLASRLTMPRGASPNQVAVALAQSTNRAPADVWTLLAGPPPGDDAALIRLATELDALEAVDLQRRSHG